MNEQLISVWKLNEGDWWAGRTLQECQQEYMKQTGYADCFDQADEQPVCDEAMNRLMFTNDDLTQHTFAKRLRCLLAEADAGKISFPVVFASLWI